MVDVVQGRLGSETCTVSQGQFEISSVSINEIELIPLATVPEKRRKKTFGDPVCGWLGFIKPYRRKFQRLDRSI